MPPLDKAEIPHRIDCGTCGLWTNLTRRAIDGWLGVTAEEKVLLDPVEHARHDRAILRQARRDALAAMIAQHPDWSVRKVQRELQQQGIRISHSTVARHRRAMLRVQPVWEAA